MALGRTVYELEKSLGSGEFHEWMVFFSLHPFGEDRADLRMGTLASITANIHRGENQPAFKPKDFMPFYDDESEMIEPSNPEEEEQVLISFFRDIGAKFKDE